MHPFGIIMILGAAVPNAAPVLVEDPAAEIERCRRSWSRDARVSGQVDVTVWLEASGRVTGVSTPANADPLAAQAAQCAVLGLKYEPAQRDGQAVAGSLVVPIGFITPPALARPPEPYEWRRCYPKYARNEGLEGRIVVKVTVGADGKLVDHSLPTDAPSWLIDAADCLVRRLEFNPGSNKGVPVATTANIPLYFKVRDTNLEIIAETVAPTVIGLKRRMPGQEDPTPVSTEEEILAAYRDCYSPEHGGSAKVTYQIKVEVSGAVRKTEVVESSGDIRLDEAGACNLRKLNFKPATVNGRAVSETLHWQLLIRPPP